MVVVVVVVVMGGGGGGGGTNHCKHAIILWMQISGMLS